MQSTAVKKRGLPRLAPGGFLARHKGLAALGAYTLGFALLMGALLLPFVQDGRFLIEGSDGYQQHFLVFQYLRGYYQRLLGQLLQGNFTLPMFDFTIGLGEDVLATLGYYGLGDPLAVLAALLAPAGKLPHAFTALYVLRIFLAGAFFIGFARAAGLGRAAAVLGGWLYAFSSLVYVGTSQTVWLHALPLLPLLLWGAVRCIQKKGPLLLALATFVLGLCGFYFLALSSFALAVTVLAASAAAQSAGGGRPRLRGFLEDILRCVLPYLAGLLMSMPLLLPQLLRFLGSNRNQKAVGALWGGLGYLTGHFYEFLYPFAWLGLAPLALLGAAALLSARGQLPRRLAVASALLPAISPFAASAMVGFTRYQSENWWYLIGFAMAFGAAAALPMLGRLGRAQKAACCLAAGLYLAVAWRQGGLQQPIMRWVAGCLLASLGVLLAFGQGRRAPALRSQRLCAGLLCALFLAGHAGSLWLWGMDFRADYRGEFTAAQQAPVTADQLAGPQLYRVDTTDVELGRWWAGANAPLRGGYNGLSAYFSLQNPNTLRALDEWGMAPARRRSFYYLGFDFSAGLNTLAGVKYLFIRPGEEGCLPCGYNLVGETPQSAQFTFTPEGGPVLHRYENLYALPLGYAYDSWLPQEEALALDGFEKQAAMLHSIVLEEDPGPGIRRAAADETLGGMRRLECEPAALIDCEQVSPGCYAYAPGAGGGQPEQAGMPECPEGQGLVVLRLAVPANSEVHLCLPQLAQENGSFGWSGLVLPGRDKDFWVTDPAAIEGGDIGREAWVNLGYYETAQQLLVGLVCPPGAPIQFGGVYARAWEMADYAAAASARGEMALQNIVAGQNSLAGLSRAQQETVLCLAVPYSEGWHATIDGQRAEPVRANSMYLALRVPAGEHAIGFYYITPGLKQGLLLCGLGLLGLAALLAWHFCHAGRDAARAAAGRIRAGAARLGGAVKGLAGRVKRAALARRGLLLALAAYTLGFAAVALAHAGPYLRQGKYFIYGADAYTQHFPAFCYALGYWKETLAGLLHGQLMPRLYDFSLGLGADVLGTLHYYGLANPFYLLALGVKTEHLPLAFSLVTVLQLYLGGLGFYAFCRKLNDPRPGAVVGAWLYVFAGFYPLAVEHPIMAHAIFYLPLLLLGCEKLLRRESPLLLALAVFGMALTGFYFLFICSAALAFYLLLRVWAMDQKPWWKAALQNAVRALAAYLAGLCMACPVFLPGVLAYLSSARTGGGAALGPGMLFAGFGALLDWLAGLADTAEFWYIGGLGVLAAAFSLAAPKARRRGPLLAGFGIAAVFVISPLAQKALVGFGETADTRFWFALQFLAAFAAARAWPQLFDLSGRQLAAGAGAAALLALALMRGGMQPQEWVWLGFLAGLLGLLAVCRRQGWSLRGRRLIAGRGLQRLGSVLLAALVLAQPALALSADGERRSPAYRDGRFACQMPPVSAETLPGGEYRVDASDVGLHRWWAPANAPLVGGYKGISEYFSILSRHYANAMLHDWALAPAQQGDFSFQGLDGCMALNTLAAVRYSFVRPGEEGYVPYGYVCVGDTPQAPGFTFTPENGAVLHRYENQYALPLGYAYTGAVSAEAYAALNGLQKQAAMMHALALADGEVPEGFAAEPRVQGVSEVQSSPTADGLVWQEGALQPLEGQPGGALELSFVLEEPAEVHLRLTGLGMQQTGQSLAFALDGGLQKEVYPMALDSGECWVNLGPAEAGAHTARLLLEGSGPLLLAGLEVWRYDAAEYEQAAAALGETALQNVVVGQNSLAGLLSAPQDLLLALAVPYSEGWHATVDGAPAGLRRANSMFMALEVPAGEHIIGLYYITPGLKQGLMLCGLGVLGLAAQLLLYHRRRKKERGRQGLAE